MEVGGEGDYYTYRYTVTTRMTLPPPPTPIKMGSEERHFNVSLIVRDKVTDSVRRPQFMKRKENRGPSAYQPKARS